MNQILDSMMRPVTRWAEHSQQQACRNAMVASTALAEVRAEWDDAQDYVETTLARRSASFGEAHSRHRVARLG